MPNNLIAEMAAVSQGEVQLSERFTVVLLHINHQTTTAAAIFKNDLPFRIEPGIFRALYHDSS
jgi:hypothetical protein